MMKKHIAFLVAAVMLILAACQPSKHGQQGQPETQPFTTIAPTQTTATPTETMKPTETTVSPTTVPATEPTEDLMAVYEEWQEYIDGGVNCMSWQYTGEPHHNPIFDSVDTSEMVAGYFYLVFFDDDGWYTEHHLIAEGRVAYYAITSEHCYYTLAGDRTIIYRTDTDGKNCTVIYESSTPLKEIRYYGTNSKGKLMFVEELSHTDRIVCYDLSNQQAEVLMEAYLIELFRYSPTSRVWNTTTERELGATIYWVGKITENDSNNGLGSNPAYYYVVETEEHCRSHLWQE